MEQLILLQNEVSAHEPVDPGGICQNLQICSVAVSSESVSILGKTLTVRTLLGAKRKKKISVFSVRLQLSKQHCFDCETNGCIIVLIVKLMFVSLF